jgi:hypothetical protein
VVNMDERLAGPRASPVFRQEVAWAEAHWAIESRGWDTVAPTDDQRDELLALLGTAGGMAAGDLVNDTLARSEVLFASQQAVRGIVAPAFTFTPGRQEKVEFGTDRRMRDPRMAAANVEYLRAKGRPPAPRLTTGAALRFREWTDDPDVALVDWTVFANGERMGLKSWRVEGLVVSQQWLVTGRQRLLPGWDVMAQARSFEGQPEPGRWSLGTITDLPVPGPPWQVRTSWTHKLPDAQGKGAEERLMVEVRALWDWRAPQAPDRPAIGDRWDRVGPASPGSLDPNDRQVVWLSDPDPVDALVAKPMDTEATAEVDESAPELGP